MAPKQATKVLSKVSYTSYLLLDKEKGRKKNSPSQQQQQQQQVAAAASWLQRSFS
jgi:hypothetical protein